MVQGDPLHYSTVQGEYYRIHYYLNKRESKEVVYLRQISLFSESVAPQPADGDSTVEFTKRSMYVCGEVSASNCYFIEV